MVEKNVKLPIVSTRDAARLLVLFQLPKVKKYIYQHASKSNRDVHAEYDKLLKSYFRLHPSFEKLTRKTEFNSNGNCSALIKKLINVI